MKPAIMELGGHGPVIVCDDAIRSRRPGFGDGKIAQCRPGLRRADALLRAGVDLRGVCGTFEDGAAALKIGNGMDPTTQLGPLANPRRVEAMERLVGHARQRGARVLAGGERIANRGYFYPLTVLADVPDDALAMNEEPFAPCSHWSIR